MNENYVSMIAPEGKPLGRKRYMVFDAARRCPGLRRKSIPFHESVRAACGASFVSEGISRRVTPVQGCSKQNKISCARACNEDARGVLLVRERKTGKLQAE